MFEELLQDLRYGVRTLARNPGFTSVAVLALAVGIGANTAMFSVVYGILLRPLPYAGADRVATVYMHFYPQNFERGTMCVADYLDWKAGNHAFEDPSAWSSRRMDLAGAGDPEQVQGAAVTSGFFATLQARPLLGRLFLPGEDRAGSPAEAVLSESLWHRRFAASPAAIGQTISVSGSGAIIVGVVPAGFGFPRENTELWTNIHLAPPTRRGPFFLRGIARLKPGVTLDQAQAETNAIGRRIMRENPYYKNLTLPVVSLREALVGSVQTPLLVLIGAVGLVLLIAVGNVANLMLARATVREREMALRLSLGAPRGFLIRQLLTESVLLALAGGAAGLALSYGGIQLLRAWNPGNLPLAGSIQLDSRALGFMLLVSVLTGVLFGLAPALQSSRANLNSTLKEGGRGTAGSARRHTRAALVIAEVALSLMLLVAAGLLLRSLARLQQVTGGFAAPPKELLTMAISPTDRKYDDAGPVRAYYDQVVERARRLPGVQSAAVSDSLPPNRQADADIFMIQGQALPPGEMNPAVSKPIVGPGYFETMRIPLRKGRYFTEYDTQSSAPVVIVSETLARHFFPGQDPIGRRIKQSAPDDPYMEIVGVVGDVKYTGLQKETDAAHYIPYRQNYGRQMFLVVRSTLGAAGLAPVLRRQIQSIDPGVTLNAVSTMHQALDTDFAQPRFNTILLVLFAGIALLLAAVGLYGVIAYSVAQRTHEIGVRMALGAGRANVLGMMMRQGARLALIGIALGLAGAFILTRLLSTLLFGVGATDPFTFAAVALGLLAVSLLATFIPAHRATRISPIAALRYE
jgi:putative ABC transport system permease protein